ncbi:MAG: PD40 domain-containing protein [Deltaproteobacteria bacterium]|nr:PD40 domain-containing protein [Deltaproteobacteria bacterium]
MKLIKKARPLIILLIISSVVVAEEDPYKTDGQQKWTVLKIENKGGRVAWHKGKNHNLIAFDSITDVEMKNTDLFVMQPDGNAKENITARSIIPRGFIGQPAWHPSGKYLVLQAESNNSKHRFFNHMAWGINNDLWIINKDGTEAKLIWSSSLNHAALHPHFNKDGTKIIFAQRTATGKSWRWIRRLNLGAGGENQWDGWNIHLADFDIDKRGKNMLSNHKTLSPNGRGFYETHGFTDNGKFIYSFTPNGQAYVDDIYVCDEDGTNVKKLIDSPATWDEHGIFSPSGKSMAFISSRGDKNWSAPKSRANTLRTELYLKRSGKIIQLTDFNKYKARKKRFLVSDYDWNSLGNKIVFQVAPLIGNRSESPELWMLTFSESQ